MQKKLYFSLVTVLRSSAPVGARLVFSLRLVTREDLCVLRKSFARYRNHLRVRTLLIIELIYFGPSIRGNRGSVLTLFVNILL